MNHHLDMLRAFGWRVAVHNDYMLDGQPMTFWLFTHPSGRWVKGEGQSDAAALRACADDAARKGEEDGAREFERKAREEVKLHPEMRLAGFIRSIDAARERENGVKHRS